MVVKEKAGEMPGKSSNFTAVQLGVLVEGFLPGLL